VHLYFVGVKRYPPSTPWVTYPPKCSVEDFTESFWALSPTNPQLPFQGALLGPNEKREYIPIHIGTDADFVLRSMQAGIYGDSTSPYFYQELFMSLMDESRNPYMNLPVHIDWLCGGGHQSVVATECLDYLPNNSQSIFASLPGLTSGIVPGQVPLSGNWHPGLVYPEIYTKANRQFYLSLFRNDSSYTTAYEAGGGTAPVVPPSINLHIAFQGSKVYPR